MCLNHIRMSGFLYCAHLRQERIGVCRYLSKMQKHQLTLLEFSAFLKHAEENQLKAKGLQQTQPLVFKSRQFLKSADTYILRIQKIVSNAQNELLLYSHQQEVSTLPVIPLTKLSKVLQLIQTTQNMTGKQRMHSILNDSSSSNILQ